MVVQVLPAPDRITIVTAPKQPRSACPLCGTLSDRVHSCYMRTVAVQVRARRFRCATAGCPRQVFAERLPGVARPRGRRTARLADIQRHIGFALGGEPGSRLAARLSMPASGDTVLIAASEPSRRQAGRRSLRTWTACRRHGGALVYRPPGNLRLWLIGGDCQVGQALEFFPPARHAV